MEVITLTKLGTFFIISIIGSKLLIKLPKYMVDFFSLINQAKCPLEIYKQMLPSYFTLISPKCSKITSLSIWSIFQYFCSQKFSKHSINSFTYIINPNTPLWSHMGFFINHPFRQNLHNIHLQPTNTSNLHIPSNLIQINTFDSKIRLTHA